MLYLLTAIGLTPGAVVQYAFTHKRYIEGKGKLIPLQARCGPEGG